MHVASVILALWMHIAPSEQEAVEVVPVALAIVAVLMASIVWWLLRQTINVRPWVERDTIGDAHGHAVSWPVLSVGLGVLLAVITSLFALFISAYLIRMRLADWSPLPEPGLLWLNTGVLVLTSVAMEWTRMAGRHERTDGVRNGLIVSGALTVAFLIGQLIVWRQLDELGYFAATNPANAFFYLLTALHGLHLLGGLVAWGRTTTRLWSGVALRDVRLSVDLCAVYWHYLLLVWLVLFGLLLVT